MPYRRRERVGFAKGTICSGRRDKYKRPAVTRSRAMCLAERPVKAAFASTLRYYPLENISQKKAVGGLHAAQTWGIILTVAETKRAPKKIR